MLFFLQTEIGIFLKVRFKNTSFFYLVGSSMHWNLCSILLLYLYLLVLLWFFITIGKILGGLFLLVHLKIVKFYAIPNDPKKVETCLNFKCVASLKFKTYMRNLVFNRTFDFVFRLNLNILKIKNHIGYFTFFSL